MTTTVPSVNTGLTNHPHYKCPDKPQTQRTCFRCFSTSHMARGCNNDIVCRFCKRPGHSERECEDRQEFRDRKRYGEYYSDILEGRQTDDSVFDGNMLNAQSPPGVVIQALSGATLLSVPTLLGESTKQLDNSHLQHVVIHLGTNDIKKYDGGELRMNATSAVEKIKKSAPHVDVTFRSVPPRKGTERAQNTANDAASNIKKYLKALSRMSFIDNSPPSCPRRTAITSPVLQH